MSDDARTLDQVRTRAELSARLSALRQASGFTVRELATKLGIPPATLGGYLTGKHLPAASQLMTFTALLTACGVTGRDEQQPWIDALTRVRSSSDGRGGRGEAPFRGLAAYGVDDAARFFGRAALVDLLVERVAGLRDRARDDAQVASRIVAVIGASGAGKSSVLNAGLVRRARDDGRTALVVTPGSDPLGALDAVTATPVDLVAVDQLEELFTHTDDADVRGRFLIGLEEISSRSSVVVGMRADFYPAAMAEPVLVPALQHNQVLVTAMSADELRSAITGPAEQAGLTVEPALLDAVLADMAPPGGRNRVHDRAHDPGALPLMSHALLATWQRARKRELTLADYRASGGIAGAVQQSAEEVIDGLDPEDQLLSRRLFLRLVNIGEDTVLTRRRLEWAELADTAPSPGGVGALVEVFVGRRLLTSDERYVQISHEALLTAWPRLHDWIDDDRDGLRRHRELTTAANTWETNARDDELLVSGTRLAAITEWTADVDHRRDLNATEREFVERSAQAEHDRAAARRRRTRRLRGLLALTAVLAVVASGLAVVAWRADVTANRERNAATVTRNAALSRHLADEAANLTGSDPTVAAELAAAAYSIFDTSEARSAVLAATATAVPTRLLTGAPTYAVAVAPARGFEAVGGVAGTVQLYRLDDAGAQAAAALHPTRKGTVYAVGFDPAGTLIAAGGSAGTVDLWDVTDPLHPHLRSTLTGFASTVYSVAFSPDGSTLAAADNDGAVRTWRVGETTTAPLATLASPAKASVYGVAFDRSSDHLAFATAKGDVELYRHATGARPSLQASVHVNDSVQRSVAFDPVADVLAVGDDSSAVRLWHVPTTGAPALLHTAAGFASWVTALAFSSDGSRLFAGSSDTSVHVIAPTTGATLGEFHQPAAVTSLAVDDRRERMITTDIDGTVRTWPWQNSSLRGATGPVFALDYSRSAVELVCTGSADGRVALWRGSRLLSDTMRSQDPTQPFGGAAAITDDGTLAASARRDGHIELWNVADPKHPRFLGVLPGELTGKDRTVEGIAFSPDGDTLASGGDDHRVRVWDVSDPQHPLLRQAIDAAQNYVMQVAFSRHGNYLAAASLDGHAYVWSMSGTRPQRRVAVVGTSSGLYSVAFSPTADVLATGSDKGVARAYSLGGRTPVPLGHRMVGPTDVLYGLAFSPTGRTLAGASHDSHLYLWTLGVATPSETVTATGGLFAVAFSPDGSTVSAAGEDKIVQRWLTSAPAAVRSICGQAGAPLTAAERRKYVPGLNGKVGCGA